MSEAEPPLVEGRGRSAGSRARGSDEIGQAAADPAFVETTWEPQEFQERVLACDRGLVCAIGGVGSGKSEAAALWLIRQAMRRPRRADGTPTEWFVVGPEFSLIRSQQFSKILNHARRLKGLGFGSVVRRVVRGQDPQIVLRDGQILRGRSGDQYQRMEGPEVDGAWLDEAQRQPEEALHTAVQRHRSSDDIRVVVSASPEDSPGWLWRLISGDRSYDDLRKKFRDELGSGVRVFRWESKANTTNKPGVLAVIGAMLKAKSEAKAGQKLGGRFPGTHELPSLSPLNLMRAFVEGSISLRGEQGRPAVMGVDIGESRDFSWLTILSELGFVLWMERFNIGTPGWERKTYYPDLRKHVQQVATMWRLRKVVVDSGKYGKPVAQELELASDLQFAVEAVDTSAPGKKSLILDGLNMATSGGRTVVAESWRVDGGPEQVVPERAVLRKECEDLVVRETTRGRDYDHQTGGHDDGPVSWALAWHGLIHGSASQLMGDLSQLLVTPGRPLDEGAGSPHGGRGRGYTF